MEIFRFIKQLMCSKRNIYLDNNATTKVSKSVRRKMNYVLKHCYGNPSSIYNIAGKSVEIIEEARQHVADAINAEAQEVYFTGCATESNNTILKSVSKHFFPNKRKIISTPIEHPSVMKTLEFLETQGIIVEYCSVDSEGRVLLDELENLIDDNTFLVCCMLANNEIGTIQNIKAITKIAKTNGALMMSDCVPAFGKIPIDVHKWGIDYASFSAHKLYGPKGVGALYVKQGSPISSFMHGGHQEEGMRAGTESLHNIAGFGEACRNVNKLLKHTEQIRNLKNQLINKLKEIKPDCLINSPEKDCLPNTISIAFPNVNNAELMAVLDHNGIAVSAGSACSSHNSKPSHVLKATGLSDKTARETIRISLCFYTSKKDIRHTIQVFHDYFNGKTGLVNMFMPEQLVENVLFDKQTYILDVRSQFQRRNFKGLPNSKEVSFFRIKKYLKQIPKNKHILVVCQKGNLSYITAYYLKSKGFDQVSSLHSGLEGWKTKQRDLYKKYTRQNIAILQAA